MNLRDIDFKPISDEEFKLTMPFYFRDEVIRQYEERGYEVTEIRHCFKTNTTSAKLKVREKKVK